MIFFFFFGRRRQDKNGCVDRLPSNFVWLRLVAVSVCTPEPTRRSREARDKEAGAGLPGLLRRLTKGAQGSERRLSEKMGGPEAPFPQLRPPVPCGLRAPARRDSPSPAQASGTPCCFTSLHRILRARNGHQSEPKVIRNQKSRGASPHLQEAAPGRRKGGFELVHGPWSLRCVSAVWTVGSKPQQLCWQAGVGRRQRHLWPLCDSLPTV